VAERCARQNIPLESAFVDLVFPSGQRS
jgi:hypothetical protein